MARACVRAPWLGPLSTKAGSFHSQADPGYRCHQCNGPCGDRTRVADSRVRRLNHWAIKVPERPSRLRLAGSLHYLGWLRWWEKNLRGCAAPVFGRMPLAKENLVENIPVAKDHFLNLSPFIRDFKDLAQIVPMYEKFNENRREFGPKSLIFSFFVKNIPLAEEFLPKIHPWLRNLGS